MGKPGRARHTQAAFSARMVSMVRRYSWGYFFFYFRGTTEFYTNLVTPPAPRDRTVWSSSIMQMLYWLT